MPRTLGQLAGITGLLGRLWLEEVDLETLNAMGTAEFREPYQELGGFIPDVPNEAIVEELAVEYCMLLIGPKGQISPVQSVWADNQFQSRTSSSMNRFFELIPDYLPGSNLSDHLGVQLDFLSELMRHSEIDSEPVPEIVGHFATSHLDWAEAFFDQVLKHSESRFYCGLAIVTRGLIHSL